jgi:hypothetical protein
MNANDDLSHEGQRLLRRLGHPCNDGYDFRPPDRAVFSDERGHAKKPRRRTLTIAMLVQKLSDNVRKFHRAARAAGAAIARIGREMER